MSVERSEHGVVSITGNAILGYRALVLKSGIGLYLKTGMLPTRGFNAGRMRAMVTEYTGKPYPRSRKGLEAAYADLCALMAPKTLDEVGETLLVNREVGGPAADL